MHVDCEVCIVTFPFSNLPSMFLDISNEGVDLLMRLLAYDPNKRLVVSTQVQKYQLFKSIH